jgi:hypothetical protein
MMLASDSYDVAIANVGEEWFFGRPDAADRLRHACNRLAGIAEEATKPVAIVLGATESTEAWQRELIDGIRAEFVEQGLAVYPTVERAAWVMGRFTRRA